MKHRRKRNYCNIFQRFIQKCFDTFLNQMLEFCRETGLHGCKYICETQRSMIDRVAWAIMVLTSLCIAIGMLRFTYDYYNEYNILSVIETTHHGIWHYPFPAVTICDLNRVSLKLSQELVEKLTLPPSVTKELIVQEMSLLDELMYPGRHGSHVRNNLSRLQIIFDVNGLSIPTVINSVTRSCQSLLGSCKWKSKEENCNTILQPSFTRDGMCCSFNYITYDRILKERSLKVRKMTSCGYQSGLNILLNFEPEDYHASIINTIGVKIILHDPFTYPNFNAPSKIIGMNKYLFLSVQPIEIYSTDAIRTTSDRECIYNDEADEIINNDSKRSLIFAKYSFINCLSDCRATTVKTKCGCIPYYYQQNKTRTCNLRDIECLETYKFWYDTSWPGVDMSPLTLSFVELDTEQRPCNCRPDCNFYRYAMESSAGYLDERVYYNGLTYTNYRSEGKTWKNQSIIHVFFDDLSSIQFRRDVRYTWRHLFATFGGLLGVFAGFSFMSIIEIVYFFIIRVITNVSMKNKSKI